MAMLLLRIFKLVHNSLKKKQFKDCLSSNLYVFSVKGSLCDLGGFQYFILLDVDSLMCLKFGFVFVVVSSLTKF